jgi:uncharacterized protein (TIGR02145 family)
MDRIWFSNVLVAGLLFAVTNSCIKVSNSDLGEPPVLSGMSINSVSTNTANCSCYINDDGGVEIISRGVCWSIVPNPTIDGNKTIDGRGTGFFKSEIKGLSATTGYYIRAYATNRIATSYGEEFFFRTFTGTITDVDGNIYKTIKIGDGLWMAENLKTTRFSDNSAIGLVEEPNVWAQLSAPGFCWYNNDFSAYGVDNGALYNWFAIDEEGNGGKKICPVGWHVPSDTEWAKLISFLGGEEVAGGKLKETGNIHWQRPNSGATNESGFTALPGGGRYYDGTYNRFGSIGGWWSSTELLSYSARGRFMYNNFSLVYSGSGSKNDGFSIRCIANK